MVTKTFFANTDAISWTADSALTVAGVADGEVAVIDIRTGLAVASIAPNAGLAPGTRLQIIQGTAAGKPQILSKIFSYRDVAYASGLVETAASASQVTTVTVTAADITSDCTLKVTDLTEGYEQFPRKSWTVQAGEFSNASELAAAFRAAIAADLSIKNFITASGATDEIILTHKVPGNSFVTSFDPADGTSNVAVAATASPSIGIGLNAQMKEIEKANEYTRGRESTNYFPQEFDSYVEAGVNYDQHVVQIENDNDRHLLRENAVNQLIVGVKDGLGSVVSSTYEKLFSDSTTVIA